MSKGILIKWSIVAAGGAGIGTAWWQLYDNLHSKTLAEEKGEGFVFSRNYTTLDDVSGFNFDDSGIDYRKLFFQEEQSQPQEFKKIKKSDCIKKFLPGQINDIQNATTDTADTNQQELKIEGFADPGKEACLNINIRYNNPNNNEQNQKGMVGKMELVAWDKNYGMIMSSIIYNLKNKFNFVNKLTYLKKENSNWNVDSSIIWLDSSSTTSDSGKYLSFSLGNNENFSFKSQNNSAANSLTKHQKYEQLLWWSDNSPKKIGSDLLGHWQIKIDKNNTDLWKQLNAFISSNKSTTPIDSKWFYKNNKWFQNKKFKYVIDKLGWKGEWKNLKKECIYETNQSTQIKNICINKKYLS